MDRMMTFNSSKNDEDNNTTTAFTQYHQQHQHQQEEAYLGTMMVPQQVVEGVRHVTGEEDNKKPRPPQLTCPRCYSSNTKFCYYNNRNILQPRYYCKACRRFWTHGGSLRDVPVGGRCRKNNKQRASPPLLPPSSSSESGSSSIDKQQQQHHHQLVSSMSSCAAEPERQDVVLPTTYGTTAEPPLNLSDAVLYSPFMSSSSFEMMPPPFLTTPTMSWTPPLPSSGTGTPSFLDMLGGFLNHEGNNSFYGPTVSSGMDDMPPFGSSTGQDATPINGEDTSTGHGEEQQGAGAADVQSKE